MSQKVLPVFPRNKVPIAGPPRKRSESQARTGASFLKNEFNPTDEYTPAESEIVLVLDFYKKHFRRPFPRARDLVTVFIALGYQKVEEVGPLEAQERLRRAGKPKGPKSSSGS